METIPSQPHIFPVIKEKVAPRDSPAVGLAAADDEATAAQMVAASFWGGTPFHLRYWRRLPDGSHRWTEIRTEQSHEPSGTQQWSGLRADIDDPEPRPQPPTKTAFNPPSDDDAVRAAKVVERLLGNAWAFDAAGRPTYLTPMAQTFVALTLEEFQAAVDEGDTVFKRTSHPDEYDRIAAAWRHSLQTGDHFYIERRIRRATGFHDWSRTAIVPTRDSQGRITGWYGGTIDLDAYRRTEAELRDRERELSQLVDMVPSHLWRLTPDGEPIFFNKRMVDFLGFDVADTDIGERSDAVLRTAMPGTSRLEAVIATVHADDAAEFRDTLGRCLATGESFVMRHRLRGGDGVYRWMSSRAEPMRDDRGRIIQWYGVSHDIDDQVHAEEAIRQSERRLQQMIDAVPVNILSFSAAGEPTYINKRYQDYLGLSVPHFDSLKEQQRAIIHPEDLAENYATLSNCFQTGAPFLMRYRRRGKDGIYRWTEGRAEPLRDRDGTILQWYAVSLDIDDEVRAQEALRESERSARQLVETLARASQAASLAELSASIAHEVNQPLAAVVFNSHACQRWLSAEPANVERAKVTVERIIRDANAAADVVSRIRALFKQSVETRDATTLAGVITEARNLMAEEAARRRVRMDVDVESNLPLVALDRVQVQQVLINLIRNGMDAMASVAGDRVLGMRVRRTGDVVRTEISDRGPGVEFPDKIFEPFFTTKEDGMGMGLAICRSIVESHGGRLWTERNEPHGATFIFTLPVEAKTAT